MASDQTGLGDVLDGVCEVVFWMLIAALGCTAIWELLESLRDPEPEEPDEWSQLSEEEKLELKRFFK